jgi:hypothetical protein
LDITGKFYICESFTFLCPTFYTFRTFLLLLFFHLTHLVFGSFLPLQDLQYFTLPLPTPPPPPQLPRHFVTAAKSCTLSFITYFVPLVTLKLLTSLTLIGFVKLHHLAVHSVTDATLNTLQFIITSSLRSLCHCRISQVTLSLQDLPGHFVTAGSPRSLCHCRISQVTLSLQDLAGHFVTTGSRRSLCHCRISQVTLSLQDLAGHFVTAGSRRSLGHCRISQVTLSLQDITDHFVTAGPLGSLNRPSCFHTWHL